MTENVRTTVATKPEILEAIRRLVRPQSTLSDVLDWLSPRGASAGPSAVVAQDEYTHDVIVRFEVGTYLVYDVT